MSTEHPARLAAKRSMEAVHKKDKQAWLDNFADDAVVEDPIGVSALDPTGKGQRGKEAIERFWDDSGDVSAVQQLRDGVLHDGVAVDFHLPPGSTATNRMMLYQFYLPRTEFTVVSDADDATAGYVFARLDADPAAVAEPPARLIWVDPRGSYGLFRR